MSEPAKARCARERSGSGEKVQLEINVQVLERLFTNGQLCAAEFSCLNPASKKAVQALCLNTCMSRYCREQTIALSVSPDLLIENKNITY